jgi:hypothetical protein
VIIDDLDASVTPDVVTRLRESLRALSTHSHFGLPILRKPFVMVAARGIFDTTGDMREQMLVNNIRNNCRIASGKVLPDWVFAS